MNAAAPALVAAGGPRPVQTVRLRAAPRPLHSVGAGLLWAGGLALAIAAGPGAAAVLAIPVGLVAAVSAARVASRAQRTKRSDPRALAVAAVVSIGVPAAALDGLAVATVALALAAVTAIGGALFLVSRRRAALVVAVLGPACASASLVVASGQGRNVGLGLVLVVAVCLYDLASWVNGNGRGAGGPGGITAGVVSMGVLALFVAAVLAPPFEGYRPWLVFGLLGLLAPAGVVLADRITGGIPLPALRRIDSLILAGPAWVVLAATVLHR